MASLSLLLLLLLASTVPSTPTNPQITSKKEKAKEVIDDLKDIGSIILHLLKNVDRDKLVDGFASSLGDIPTVGNLVGGVVKMIYAFVPTSDPVLSTLMTGFDDINKKLTSMMREVKFDTWAKATSKAENKIKNGWEKFLQLLEGCVRENSADKKKELIKTFTDFYSSNNIENAVMNLYNYMTAKKPETTENFLHLLVKTFKCDVLVIKTYTSYLKARLWQGILLNQIYYGLTGKYTDVLAEDAAKKFYTVNSEVQENEIQCIKKYKTHLKTDIQEISIKKNGNEWSLDNKNVDKKKIKKQLADKLRVFLKEKYSWYDWIVVVYKSNPISKNKHILTGAFTEFTVAAGELTVAVAHTLPGKHDKAASIAKAISNCVGKDNKRCSKVIDDVNKCGPPSGLSIAMPDTLSAIHVSHKETDEEYEAKKVPESSEEDDDASPVISDSPKQLTYISKGQCVRYRIAPYKKGYFYVYIKSDDELNKVDPCSKVKCEANGNCERLLDTAIAICKCPNGFYGARCENSLEKDKKMLKAKVSVR